MVKRGLLNPQYLADIADAIREKNGSEETYTPPQMAPAIEAISTGAPDGKEWTYVELPAIRACGRPVWNEKVFLACLDGRTESVRSEDGVTWTSWGSVVRTALCAGNGIIIGAISGSTSAGWTDGDSWRTATTPSSGSWSCSAWGNGRFVMLTSSSGKCVYSDDGQTWTESTLPAVRYWFAAAYGKRKYVALALRDTGGYTGTGSKFCYSEDGITWTEGNLPAAANWGAMAYGDGRFVAVSQESSKRALFSEDGVNWTLTALPHAGNWASVCYGNGKFLAFDRTTGGAWTADGVNWSPFTVEGNILNYGVWGRGKFVAMLKTNTQAAYSLTTKDQ